MIKFLQKITERTLRKIIDVFGYEIHTRGSYANVIRLAELKGIHRGQRAFIVGSGPSLEIQDLSRLKKEITFACNKIYLAFDKTDWRPTYYTVIDRLIAKNNYRRIQKIDIPKIFSSVVKPSFGNDLSIRWVRDLPSPVIDGERTFMFSKDIVKGVYGGFTVIYTQLQIAFYMGIRKVYLLGIDFSFNLSPDSGRKTSGGEPILVNTTEVNHFHPDYRKPGETWTMPRLDFQYQAFRTAKQAFLTAGGEVINLSRKTKLDVFPLGDFDEVISGTE